MAAGAVPIPMPSGAHFFDSRAGLYPYKHTALTVSCVAIAAVSHTAESRLFDQLVRSKSISAVCRTINSA